MDRYKSSGVMCAGKSGVQGVVKYATVLRCVDKPRGASTIT